MIEQAHEWWSWVVIVGNGAAALWCLGAHWLPPLRIRGMWAVVAVAQVTVFVQVALGVYLVAVEGISVPGLHAFYGFIAIVAVAIIYGYRTQLRAQQYLLYGFGGLFLMGLGIRALFLA